jgi:hypothetical protein
LALLAPFTRPFIALYNPISAAPDELTPNVIFSTYHHINRVGPANVGNVENAASQFVNDPNTLGQKDLAYKDGR